MNIRKSTKDDLTNIALIIEEGKAAMALQGIDQWNEHYPTLEMLARDIELSESFVITDDVSEMVGTFVLTTNGEEAYKAIYEGVWSSDEPYVTIHRGAITERYKGQGLATKMLKYAELYATENNISYIRVDTHNDNLAMRKVLEKNGYIYCGIIYVYGGATRVAYDKILNNIDTVGD